MKHITIQQCIVMLLVLLGTASLSHAENIDYLIESVGKDSPFFTSGNGIEAETLWVRDVLGLDSIEFQLKYEADPDEDLGENEFFNQDVVRSWIYVDNSGDTDPDNDDVWKTQFVNPNATPDYFLIKTGNLKPSLKLDYRYFLFDNDDSLSWAVIDLSDMFGIDVPTFDSNDFGKFSHISVFLTPVPEPAAISMLFIGICGVITTLHKREKITVGC